MTRPGGRPAPGRRLVVMTGVERPRLISDGTYAAEQVTFRRKDLLAVDTLDPMEIAISWEQLDEWL